MADEQFPVEEIRNKIKDILSEPEIRFCGLIDSDGKLVAGDFKDGVIPFETDKKEDKCFRNWHIEWQIEKDSMLVWVG